MSQLTAKSTKIRVFISQLDPNSFIHSAYRFKSSVPTLGRIFLAA